MNLRSQLLLFTIILTLALTPASASDAPPETRQQLLQNFNQTYQEADFVGAIRWGLKLEDLEPGQSGHQYNLACVYALVGNDHTAIAWLRRSARNGFRQVALLETDLDLETLREHQQWSGIVAAVRRNDQSYKHTVRQAFSQVPPEIVLPPEYDPEIAAPLIIALHGYGGRSDGYPALWRPAAGKIGAILATPQGQQGLGDGFFWGDLEEADLVVHLTIEYVKSLHLIDRKRIVLTGFSQGGFMAMALGLRHPSVFAGVIPMAAGYISRIDAPAPIPAEAPRYFFMVGSRDQARSQCRKAAEDFEAAGYQVDLRVYPGVGHTFPRSTNGELGRALGFVLE